MNIDIICVGKIKEAYLKDACSEYLKRLSKYAKVSVIEVADEKTPDKQAEALDAKVKETEGARILKAVRETAYVITLEIKGEEMTSEELAAKLSDLGISGKSDIQVIIGGSLGLDEAVIKRADLHLSFSRMTFPHQLMRVILLEQLYRSFRINNNEPYHK